MLRRALLLLAFVAGACRPSEATPNVAPDPPPLPAAKSAAPDAAPPPRPVPPLSAVSKLTLEQMQGGPSMMRCKGIVFRVVLDVKKNEWTEGTCLATNGADTSTAPLTMRHGKLSPQQRTPIDVAYEGMTVATSTSCGHDGGPLSLRIETSPGHEETYVDENWGCRKPAPEIAVGVKTFRRVVLSVLQGAP